MMLSTNLIGSRLFIAIVRRIAFLPAALSFPIAQAQENPFEVPLYFSAPLSAWLDTPKLRCGESLASGDPVIHAFPEHLPGSKAGLRMVAIFNDKGKRGDVMDDLMAQGILMSGDVILNFRPEWARTMPYPHIQMGISHAGLIRCDGKCRNLDVPLESHYNRNFDSQLDSDYYLKFSYYHIMRPRGFDARARASFEEWCRHLTKHAPTLQGRHGIPFNGNYLAPRYAALEMTPANSVLKFRNLMMSPDSASPMSMYCSEFVWHFHSVAASGPPGEPGIDAGRVRLIVDPEPMAVPAPGIGLGGGPLAVLRSVSGDLSRDQLQSTIQEIFTERETTQLSPGHRDASHHVRPLMSVLRAYYEWSLAPQDAEAVIPSSADDMISILNRDLPPNYSPTLFLINSFLDKNDPRRRFDYVCTLAFVNGAAYSEAKKLAAGQRTLQPEPGAE